MIRIRRCSRSEWTWRFVKALAWIWRTLLVRTRFVVVTGSVGKTTAKELIYAILSSRAPTVATRYNDNGIDRTAETILRVRPWHRFAVLEAGTGGPGWIARIASLVRPDIAVILNVGHTHTDQFPTLDDTAREKAALLTALRPRGVAILNDDDPRVAAMAVGRGFRVVRFGLTDRADVRATAISSPWPERLALTIESRGLAQRIQTRLVGVNWAPSVLAAAAVALECGVALPDIAAAVAGVPPTPARLDPRALPSGAVILRDDYNGSLQTFEAALQVLREARACRKILAITTVTDTPDSWGRRLRRLVFAAAPVCQAIVLVGSRHQTARSIQAAVKAGFPAGRFYEFGALSDAAAFLREFLRDGDLLLLRGRIVDHVGRLYHAQTAEVSCWLDRCPKRDICDRCPELFAIRPAPPTCPASCTPPHPAPPSSPLPASAGTPNPGTSR